MQSTTPILLLLSLATPLAAQHLIVNDSPAATFLELAAISPLHPGGLPPVNGYPHTPPLPGPIPLGAVSVDAATGLTWHTDGFLVAAGPHNWYPPAIPPIPPWAPPPMPAGPIHGMAVDSAAGLLWMTDGVFIQATIAAFNGPLVVPPVPLAFGFPPPMTGLDWDPVTGTLWGVDIQGVCWNFNPGGFLVGPPTPPVPTPGPPVGIAIDKTGNSFPPGAPRPIYVLGGSLVFEVWTGVVIPVTGSGGETGLSFHAVPASFPPGPCACPSLPGLAFQPGSNMYAGNPAFSIDIFGLPPGGIAIYGFDFGGFNPAFPVLNTVGCGYGLNVVTSFGVLANGAGMATLPISLVTAPVGTTAYVQMLMPCAADALGFVLSPTYQIMVSAP